MHLFHTPAQHTSTHLLHTPAPRGSSASRTRGQSGSVSGCVSGSPLPNGLAPPPPPALPPPLRVLAFPHSSPVRRRQLAGKPLRQHHSSVELANPDLDTVEGAQWMRRRVHKSP
ncbi:hypothetical protein E2C01_073185 [Portunus trituberculatus]|uniref:Uncharacterized protein n=1 Tax=Portunus trituberculatus TaxID=210409 RepID=A0A5B7I043_PORTR|nr:hypothetical protein [Portunus trituberculatus]